MEIITEIEGLNLTDYQEKILNSPKRFTVSETSTKIGKTISHIWWLFKESHLDIYPKYAEFWWVAPIYNQTEIAFNRLKNKLIGKEGYQINYSKLYIITPKQTIIRFKSAEKPDHLFGENVYAAVFDEFTRAKEEAWFALRTTLTTTRGKCKLIGNYKGNANWGHQLALKAQDPDSEYEYFRITAWDAVEAGILQKEEIEQAKKDLPINIFKELYLAEESEQPGRLITSDAINDLFSNEHIKGNGIYSLTADIAMQGSDKFVIFIWNGDILIDFKIIDKCGSKEIILQIKSFQTRYGIGNSRIVYDNDGVGAFLGDFFPGSLPFVNNAKPIEGHSEKDIQYVNLKSQCYFLISKDINKRNIYIKCDLGIYKNDFIEELELVMNRSIGTDNKLSILKKEEIKRIIGRSSDLTDALMMKKYLDIRIFETNFIYTSKRQYK